MVATGFAWLVGNFGLTDPPLLFTLGSLLNNLFVALRDPPPARIPVRQAGLPRSTAIW